MLNGTTLYVHVCTNVQMYVDEHVLKYIFVDVYTCVVVHQAQTHLVAIMERNGRNLLCHIMFEYVIRGGSRNFRMGGCNTSAHSARNFLKTTPI